MRSLEDYPANAPFFQVAYLMADISDVRISEIKEISENLEALSCECQILLYHIVDF